MEQTFENLDGRAGKAGLLTKDGLLELMTSLLLELGFAQAKDTEFLGARYVETCWEQHGTEGTVEIGDVVNFVVGAWQQSLGLEMAVSG